MEAWVVGLKGEEIRSVAALAGALKWKERLLSTWGRSRCSGDRKGKGEGSWPG